MNFIDTLRQENILIVGFGYRTGFATANYLLSKGISPSVSDSKTKEDLADLISQLKGELKNLYCGQQDFSQLDNIDRIILSPGVPRAIPLIQEAYKRGITVTSEVELAYQLCKPKMVIGITGTDGKTTTTTLCYDLLNQEFKVKLGGNIGIPVISFVDEVDAETIVLLELSSYQLEDTPHFKCDIAALLNLSHDHLDRYNSFQDYIDAKKNIFKNQTDKDYGILNLDDPNYNLALSGLKSQLLNFSKRNQEATCYIDQQNIVYNNRVIASIADTKLKGIHNLENILAAVIIAKLAGLSNKAIQKTLNEFKGLAHRNEYVDTVQGIEFVNDSKATTINSVVKSILSQEKPILLLMGGQDKGLDFAELRPFVREHVKDIILFGEAKEKISAELAFESTLIAKDLDSAFKLALKRGSSGDVVLLSPGCTSFDQYKSYEERGNHFKALVNEFREGSVK